jgi:hypothetical protein
MEPRITPNGKETAKAAVGPSFAELEKRRCGGDK